MEAKIVFYKQDNLDQNAKFNLRKELLGLEQKSNFSRYSYKVNGVLDEIPHYKPVDSAIIVKSKDVNKIKKALKKHKIKHQVFKVDIPKGKLAYR